MRTIVGKDTELQNITANQTVNAMLLKVCTKYPQGVHVRIGIKFQSYVILINNFTGLRCINFDHTFWNKFEETGNSITDSSCLSPGVKQSLNFDMRDVFFFQFQRINRGK